MHSCIWDRRCYNFVETCILYVVLVLSIFLLLSTTRLAISMTPSTLGETVDRTTIMNVVKEENYHKIKINELQVNAVDDSAW